MSYHGFLHAPIANQLLLWVRKSITIAMMALLISPAEALAINAGLRRIVSSAGDFFAARSNSPGSRKEYVKLRQVETQKEREDRVFRIRLCPRRLSLFTGEHYVLDPLALDRSGEIVHGIRVNWESSDQTVVDVQSDGSVLALKPGNGVITASVGVKREKISVVVRAGGRPLLTNAQWDVEHAHDCDDPEGASDGDSANNRTDDHGFAAAVVGDPDDFHNSPSAASTRNAVGGPRFTPEETPSVGIQKAKNQLGSSNFGMIMPIFQAAGRGVSVDLSLSYNSRLWTKEANQIIFDYDQGWPAPGFRLNYGRIIPDYDVPTGFSGNYLLIESDGTRTALIHQVGTPLYRSDDGRFVEFETDHNILSYPDGTITIYEFNGSKLLPAMIRDAQGNSVSIVYVNRNAGQCSDAQRTGPCTCGQGCNKPPRQAINYITDSLGRQITFYYQADGNLAEIRVAGYSGGPDRTVAKLAYQPVTISFSFGSIQVVNAVNGGQTDMLRRVYFPDTGRGYLFDSYSSYGMCTRVSMMLGMTDLSDGTIASTTEYLYQTSGTLSDAPQFTERREWWQGKTDDFGNSQDASHPAVFTYGRSADNSTNWVIAPNGVRSESVTINNPSSSLFGLVATQRMVRVSDGAILAQSDFSYNDRASISGLQRNSIIITDPGSPQTRTDSIFGQYGRLLENIEYGFPISGAFKKRRRTVYTYLDAADYINQAMYRLVSDVTVYDAHETNTTDDDTPIARTGFIYDTADPGWETETYGFTRNCSTVSSPPCSPPPGYNTKFVDRTFRGLLTKTQKWTNANAPLPNLSDITFRNRYDIFGNQIKTEVSCCSVKRLTYSGNPAGLYYSAPLSIIDGPESGPNASNSFSYDFNTSFLNATADSNSLAISFVPDAAMRIRTVTHATGAVSETSFVDPAFAKDGLVYQSKLSYLDGSSQKVQITNQWLDGLGHVIRVGSAAGAAPASFDAVKSIYDEMGRSRKTTNPYVGDSTGNIFGLPNATVFEYDDLSRVRMITFADGNTITAVYSGQLTTITDQAARQRRSEVDGLGRIVKVTEMDNSKVLGWDTTYGYDLNDNVTSVNQGGQTRAYKYDSLSRMIFERTPEHEATINDGTGALWSAKYNYTSFNALATREDARHVVTTYSYDGLNRPSRISYSLPVPNPDNVQQTPTLDISYGSTIPRIGQVEEIKQSFSAMDVPWKETYVYDPLSRVSAKTVSFDNGQRSYTTGYGYNQAGQLIQLTYPSSRIVKYAYDARGRLNTVGDGSTAGKYVSNVAYTASQQAATMALGNGLTEGYSYSPDRLQLISQNVKQNGTTLMSFSYNYVADRSRFGGIGSGSANTGQLLDITNTQVKDPGGNILNRNESYSYDQVSRLVQSSGFYAARTYSYDRFGNRTAVAGGTMQNVTLQQSGGVTNNRIASVNGGPGYSYDAAGNTIYDAAHNFNYDAESRLTRVDGGATATYSYDAGNRRVKKIAQGFTTYYIWEGNKVIAEYGDGPGTNGATRFYHPDRLSNRMITDAAGTVKGVMDNLPFGENAGVIGESEKHRFGTYERDVETDSDYAVNRQHQFLTGRFMRTDPVAGSIASPQSLNRYSYVADDPINSADPLGLVSIELLGCQPLIGVEGFPVKFFDSIVQVCTFRVVNTALRVDRDWGGGREVRRVGTQRTPDQCLKDCYKNALDGYDAAGNTTSQGVVDLLKEFSPLNIFRLGMGLDEASKVLKGGPSFITSNGLQGPIRAGSLGSALGKGASKALGMSGPIGLGLSLGGLSVQAMEPFLGRDKAIRDAVDECNSGCKGATSKVESSIFGTAGRVRDFLIRH